MDEPAKEYHFKCDHCDVEVFVHAHPDDELEEIWPGPYCQDCGHFKAFRLTADTRLKLFWVETADHSEDWFVVTRDRFEAEVSFEWLEGMKFYLACQPFLESRHIRPPRSGRSCAEPLCTLRPVGRAPLESFSKNQWMSSSRSVLCGRPLPPNSARSSSSLLIVCWSEPSVY